MGLLVIVAEFVCTHLTAGGKTLFSSLPNYVSGDDKV